MFAVSVSASLRIKSRRSQLKQAHTLRSVLINRDQDSSRGWGGVYIEGVVISQVICTYEIAHDRCVVCPCCM